MTEKSWQETLDGPGRQAYIALTETERKQLQSSRGSVSFLGLG